jgi:hypothetical protein
MAQGSKSASGKYKASSKGKVPLKPAPIDVQVLRLQFADVRELPRATAVGIARSHSEDLDENPPEPSFRRLFTHETWRRYTGGPTIARWFRAIYLWRFSSVMQAVLPCALMMSVWSLLVCRLLPARWASYAMAMQLPLSLQGAAIGLLLVFRTNNAYRRLEQARTEVRARPAAPRRRLLRQPGGSQPPLPPRANFQWGNMIYICRDIAAKCAATLDWEATCYVCRYLSAFAWSLRDKLRDAERRDDILKVSDRPGRAYATLPPFAASSHP